MEKRSRVAIGMEKTMVFGWCDTNKIHALDFFVDKSAVFLSRVFFEIQVDFGGF